MDKSRTVKISGPIKNLRVEANKMLKMADTSKNPISVVIDSPGGNVIGGLPLITAIDRIRSRGIQVNCVVDGMAMSMATHIIAACSNRYAMPTSLIMWHPIAINLMYARLTVKSTHQVKTQLVLLSKYLDTRLRLALGLKKAKFLEYHEGEYILFAETLEKKVAPKFLTLVSDIRTKK